MKKLLCIAIPTVIDRHEKFNRLRSFIQSQIDALPEEVRDLIELISLSDNKEMSIGTKRDKLYRMSRSRCTVMIDDDDWVADDFVVKVYEACLEDKDCVGYIESVSFDGKDGGNSLFSMNYPDWIEDLKIPMYNTVRVRTPFFKTPIKTEICTKVGVADMRWSEDHDFARRVLPHLKSMAFIPEVMYKYGFVTEGNYWERFGIKK